MATPKKPLSSVSGLERPVKASDWFATFDKLPTEVIRDEQSKREAIDLIERTMIDPQNNRNRDKGKQKLSTPVKAADWFAVNKSLPGREYNEVRDIISETVEPPKTKRKKTVSKSESSVVEVEAPENIDVSVDVNVMSAPGGSPSLSSKQEALEAAQKEKSNKEIESLITSILNLTKTIQKDRLDRLKGYDDDDDDEKKKAPKSITELFKTIASDKITSVKEKLSIRNLLIASGVKTAYKGTDTVLDQVLGYVENRKNREQQSSPTVAGSVLRGTSDYTGTKIKSMMSPVASRIGDASERLLNTRIGQGVTTVLGGTKSLLNAPKNVFNRVNNLMGMKAKEAAILRPHSLLGSIARQHIPSIANDQELRMSQVLTNPETKEEKKFTEAVRSGMRDELLELNEEQLKELKKLVSAMTETKEDKLEREDKAPAPIVINEKKKEKEKEESILSNLMGLWSKGKSLGGTLGKLKNLGGGLLRGGAALATNPTVLGAAGVAAAGTAGYGVGSLINKTIINPAAEAISGTEGATLGTAIYDGVDKVKGWFGNSDADKMDRAMGKGRSASGKIVDLTKSSTGPSPLVSVANSHRIEQMKEVKDRIQKTELIKEKKETASSKNGSSVVDARTTVVNNSKNVQYVRPSIQNHDPTFNHLLRANFNH